MKSFQRILQKKAHTYQAESDFGCDEKTVVFLFEKIIKEEYGNQGFSALTTVQYSHKTVYLQVGRSVWKTEFELQKNSLRKKLNQYIGQQCVEKIVIKRD